jgi:CRP/FNR family transcriptional regulator, dissimilatory nitrate respiration regulator
MDALMVALSRCPIFGRMGPEDLEHLAGGMRRLHVRAGDPVFREGQPCEGFYVVLSGSVRVFKLSTEGRQRILHIVRPPFTFAEAAMFGAGTYPASAEAMEPSDLVLIRQGPFLRLIRERPDAALRLFESLSLWLRRLLDHLENETFLNSRAKLASYLLREARRGGCTTGPCQVVLTAARKDIASQLGMAPETLSRAQADLEARNLIRPSGRRVALSDVAALERLVLGEST